MMLNVKHKTFVLPPRAECVIYPTQGKLSDKMSNGSKEAGDFSPSGDRVAFDYVKASGFHALRADGAIGGVTAHGHIHMALYSERPSIPRRVVYAVDAGGALGAIIEEDTINRGSIVRELSADIFLTVEVAESICVWLNSQVTRGKALMAEAKSEGEG